MFTGIVENMGTIVEAAAAACGRRLTVDVSGLRRPLAAGDSVSVDGVCLTAVDPDPQRCRFDVIHETLRRTTLGRLQPGQTVNLERSMSASGTFDGHIVQGHVDATAVVDAVDHSGGERLLWVAHAPELTPLIVPKGSIAINGCSLTIALCDGRRFAVALIPTTLQLTNLGTLQPRDLVNIETDILARTIHHQLEPYRRALEPMR